MADSFHSIVHQNYRPAKKKTLWRMAGATPEIFAGGLAGCQGRLAGAPQEGATQRLRLPVPDTKCPREENISRRHRSTSR